MFFAAKTPPKRKTLKKSVRRNRRTHPIPFRPFSSFQRPVVRKLRARRPGGEKPPIAIRPVSIVPSLTEKPRSVLAVPFALRARVLRLRFTYCMFFLFFFFIACPLVCGVYEQMNTHDPETVLIFLSFVFFF